MNNFSGSISVAGLTDGNKLTDTELHCNKALHCSGSVCTCQVLRCACDNVGTLFRRGNCPYWPFLMDCVVGNYRLSIPFSHKGLEQATR